MDFSEDDNIFSLLEAKSFITFENARAQIEAQCLTLLRKTYVFLFSVRNIRSDRFEKWAPSLRWCRDKRDRLDVLRRTNRGLGRECQRSTYRPTQVVRGWEPHYSDPGRAHHESGNLTPDIRRVDRLI
jgi:hypothetical protein